jgi:GABA permease
VRLPKSETDAFYLAYAGGLLIVVSGALGALVSVWAGVALFVGGCLGAIGWDLLTENPDRRESLREAAEAAPEPPAGDRIKRILVISNETLLGRELREELLRRGKPRAELRVVAPVLPSRSHYLTSDIDRDLAEARRRLDATLEWAHGQGFDAAGRVGDDTPPLTAIEDELRRFPADELVISTHPPGRSHWLETGLVERSREELEIPITHVIVDLERQQVEITPGDAEQAARRAVGYER